MFPLDRMPHLMCRVKSPFRTHLELSVLMREIKIIVPRQSLSITEKAIQFNDCLLNSHSGPCTLLSFGKTHK